MQAQRSFLIIVVMGMISLLIAAPASATCTWFEDGGDTVYVDFDEDGIADRAYVDLDSDGNWDEMYVDKYDDGTWDGKLIDTDDDGDWDSGKKDINHDGSYDLSWTDANANNLVEIQAEVTTINPPEAVPAAPAPGIPQETRDCCEDGTPTCPDLPLVLDWVLAPAVSEWGLIITGLLGVTVGTIVFTRRRKLAA